VTAGGNLVAWRWRRGAPSQIALPFQYTMSTARAVNRSGQIVGWAVLANGWHQPFVFTEAGGAVGIQPWYDALYFGPHPFDINTAGTIVGTMPGVWGPIEWTPAGGDWTWDFMESLDGYINEADAVNDAGVIAGTSMVDDDDGDATMVGWVMHPGFAPYAFPSFGEVTVVGDINAGRVIVGVTGDPPGLGTHFRRSAAGVMFDLHVPSDSVKLAGHAEVAISDRDRIVGTDGALHRAFTLRGDTLTYLPLPPNGWRSVAGDVNACGVIAGSVSYLGKNVPEVAVIWRRVSGVQKLPVCD